MLTSKDQLTVGEVAHRSGFAPSALRFYEREGLLSATRTSGGQRRYERHVLRRLAFIRAARNIGLSLEEVKQALASLPGGRTPTVADWTRVSSSAAISSRLSPTLLAARMKASRRSTARAYLRCCPDVRDASMRPFSS